jgi:hypothetical protein
MPSFAYSSIAFVCGLKRVGSRIARTEVGPASGKWDSLAIAWDWRGQGSAPMHPRPPPQVRVSYSNVGIRNLSPHLRNIADNQSDCGVAD